MFEIETLSKQKVLLLFISNIFLIKILKCYIAKTMEEDKHKPLNKNTNPPENKTP